MYYLKNFVFHHSQSSWVIRTPTIIFPTDKLAKKPKQIKQKNSPSIRKTSVLFTTLYISAYVFKQRLSNFCRVWMYSEMAALTPSELLNFSKRVHIVCEAKDNKRKTQIQSSPRVAHSICLIGEIFLRRFPLDCFLFPAWFQFPNGIRSTRSRLSLVMLLFEHTRWNQNVLLIGLWRFGDNESWTEVGVNDVQARKCWEVIKFYNWS